MMIERSKIRKILVIKLRAIGDVVLSTVVIPNLRKAFPEAVIDFLTEKPSRTIVEGNPHVSSVLVFDPRTQRGIDVILAVRRNRYDLVIDLFGNPRSAVITLLSGAKHRIGYRFGWRRWCYNIVAEPRGGVVHNTDFNLDALRIAGIPVEEKVLHVPISPEDELFADRFFTENNVKEKLTVAINAAGGWYTKRWSVARYAALADIISERTGAAIILLWGPGEREEVERMQSMMKQNALLIPQTSLNQLAAILKRCSMMVTNDSGPMHIAASVKTPIVAIFGPTNPVLQGPFDTASEIVRNERLDCLGCNLTTCPIGNPCMEQLSVDEVLTAFERLKTGIKI